MPIDVASRWFSGDIISPQMSMGVCALAGPDEKASLLPVILVCVPWHPRLLSLLLFQPHQPGKPIK